MIAFSCKQCGKRFDRPESSAGTVVFCTCGGGTTVPWESTLPPVPEPPPAAPSRWAAAVPSWEPEGIPAVARPAVADPNRCFVHSHAAKKDVCAECRLAFCGDCLVMLNGAALCGPCKNHRLRATQRPPHLSVLALLAPLLSIGAGFLWILVFGAAVESGSPQGMAVVGMIGLIPQGIAALLAALALRRVERDPRVSGRALAMTGLVAALVCAVVLGEVTVLLMRMKG